MRKIAITGVLAAVVLAVAPASAADYSALTSTAAYGQVNYGQPVNHFAQVQHTVEPQFADVGGGGCAAEFAAVVVMAVVATPAVKKACVSRTVHLICRVLRFVSTGVQARATRVLGMATVSHVAKAADWAKICATAVAAEEIVVLLLSLHQFVHQKPATFRLLLLR